MKTITRHVWEDSKERINAHRLTPAGKAIYTKRKLGLYLDSIPAKVIPKRIIVATTKSEPTPSAQKISNHLN
jgi:hypothetical protein